jgi:glutamate carboxypeptidase
MEKIRAYLEEKKNEMLGLLEKLVNIDSGTYCIEGINECGKILAEALQSLGFQTKTIEEIGWGNHVSAERPGTGDKRLFLSSHLDTVCPQGTAAKRPFRIEGDYAFGPGVGDMKGGIVQMIYALKALKALGRETPPISVFLTGDEEVGSVLGRPHIEKIARRSTWALVTEPTTDPEGVTVKRWGVGAFYLTILGQSAHVLAQSKVGVNACRELAMKILALEGLSDPVRGVKVSVNLVKGGTSRQVSASEAKADIDLRVQSVSEMDDVEKRFRKVAETPILPGIQIKLEGKLTRPPMEPNPNTEAFLEIGKAVGQEMGLNVHPIEKLGGSDGCFTAALGVATLDGMGPMCYDSCSDTERIDVNSLVPRTQLMAGIIQRLTKMSKN